MLFISSFPGYRPASWRDLLCIIVAVIFSVIADAAPSPDGGDDSQLLVTTGFQDVSVEDDKDSPPDIQAIQVDEKLSAPVEASATVEQAPVHVGDTPDLSLAPSEEPPGDDQTISVETDEHQVLEMTDTDIIPVQMEVVTTESEPTMVEAEPGVAEIEPVAAESEPAMVGAESAITETKATVVQTEPAKIKAEPAMADIDSANPVRNALGLEIVNATEVDGAETPIVRTMEKAGYKAINAAHDRSQHRVQTYIYYRDGFGHHALDIGGLVSGDQVIVQDDHLPNGVDVRIMIGDMQLR